MLDGVVIAQEICSFDGRFHEVLREEISCPVTYRRNCYNSTTAQSLFLGRFMKLNIVFPCCCFRLKSVLLTFICHSMSEYNVYIYHTNSDWCLYFILTLILCFTLFKGYLSLAVLYLTGYSIVQNIMATIY